MKTALTLDIYEIVKCPDGVKKFRRKTTQTDIFATKSGFNPERNSQVLQYCIYLPIILRGCVRKQ